MFKMPPPAPVAPLPLKVLLVTVIVPLKLAMPPPVVPVLLLKVLLVMLSVPSRCGSRRRYCR